MDTKTVVLLIIFAFTFIPLILAEFARGRSIPDAEDFFLQSRNMPLNMAFFTVYATWVSSFAFLGSTASLYADGPLYMTCFAWNALFGLLYMVIGRRLWFVGKEKGHLTPTDFFNGIFRSELLNITITMILSIFTLPYLMIQLYAGAYIIETASGGLIPWKAAGLVFCFIMVIYLWAGGMRAIALTDIFYGLLIFFTMLATGFVLIEKSGGIEKTFAEVVKRDPDAVILGSGFADNSPLAWLCMFIIIPIGALMGPPMWLRAYSTKKEKIFKIMPLLLMLATIMYLGPLLVAATARVLYPDIESGDKLIPYLLVHNVPIIVTTILLCGIAAAALSTANSQIHGLATLYTVDIHRRYVRRESTGRQLVVISKWVILILTGIAYILMLKNHGMIIAVGTLGMGGTAQIIVPTIGALFWERSNSKAAIAGLVFGITTLCVLCFLFDVFIPYAAVLSLFSNALIFFILSLLLTPEPGTGARISENKLKFILRNTNRKG